MTKTYKKTRKQHQKEMKRRRKLRDLMLNERLFTETELASALGCSQATVSRDLSLLHGTRWDPFMLAEKQLRKEISDKLEGLRWKTNESVNKMGDKELIEIARGLV